MEDAFYKLMNVYLSPWFGARTLLTFGFAPQMKGVLSTRGLERLRRCGQDHDAERLKRKQTRFAVAGNSWQNVFPTKIRAYQDAWARVQAA